MLICSLWYILVCWFGWLCLALFPCALFTLADANLLFEHNGLPEALPSSPILEAHKMGMYHIALTGVLQPASGAVTVTLVTYLKACIALNGSLVRGWRKSTVGSWSTYGLSGAQAKHMCYLSPTQIWHGRTTVYEPTTETFEANAWEHHMSRHDIVSTLQPHFFLRLASNNYVHPTNKHTDYNFTFATPYPYEKMQLWKGYPWVINMCMDNPPSNHVDFYFGVDDWQYSAPLTSGFMRIPQYVPPDTVSELPFVLLIPKCT